MKLKSVFILMIISAYFSSSSQQYITNPRITDSKFIKSLVLERIELNSNNTYFYFNFKLADYTSILNCLTDSIILRDPWNKILYVEPVIGFPNMKNKDLTNGDSVLKFFISFKHLSDSANYIDLYSTNKRCFLFHGIDISKQFRNNLLPKQNVNPENISSDLIQPTLNTLKDQNLFVSDLIIMKDGSEIKAKIIEVGITEIKYKRIDNINGPSYSCLKSDIIMIKYSNGTKDIFNEKEIIKEVKIDDLCDAGEKDAANFYQFSGGGSFILTILFSPLIGVIATSAISNNKPQRESLNAPNPELLKNISYKDCYVDKAYSMKKHTAWTGFWIGFIIDIVAYSIILNAN
jgi:hypothetical protein